jgi:dolichyl-phosphate-mannose--protein O-mannosyl transferase
MSLARAIWKGALARVPRLSHPATGYILVFMVVAGVVLRIQNIGYPFHFNFDEDQYVGAAHQFLVGVPDTGECCHPPLSKLLIGVGMVLFGNTPLGWRFIPLVFGLQSIVLVFIITSVLFQDRRAGWLAAAFMSADGFFLAYSRAGLPDGILACCVLWCLLAAITARGWGGVFACAVMVGAAASLKWVAVLVGLPACVAILLLRRVPWYTLVCFAVVPLVHLGVWMIGLRLIGHPNDVASVIAEIRHRAGLHLGFVHATNPLESPWFSWLVMYHPIVIKHAQQGTTLRLASSVGNPVLWFAADACLLAMPIAAVAMARRPQLRERWRAWFDADSTRALLILGISWVSMMLLWFTRRIVTYWYHYLTSWGIAIAILGGVVWRLDRRYPRGVLIFVLVVLAVSIYFAPVWAELPISAAGAHRRLIFPLWR